MHFAKDGKAVLYVQRDEKVRNARIVFHLLGDVLQENDQVLFEEPDEAIWLSLEVSKCKNFFLVYKVSKQGNQVRSAQQLFVADRNTPQITFYRLSSLEDQVVDLKFSNKGLTFHANNSFYFVSASSLADAMKQAKPKPPTAKEKQKQPASSPQLDIRSVELQRSTQHSLLDSMDPLLAKVKKVELARLPHDEVINETDFFDDAIVLYISKISRVKLLFARLGEDFGSSAEKSAATFEEVSLPRESSFGLVKPAANHNAKQEAVRFFVDGAFVYNNTYDLHVSTGKPELIEEFRMLGKPFDPRRFETSVVFAPTRDGKQVPITLVHPKGYLNSDLLPKASLGPRKLLLKSYGCYGMSMHLEFETATWSLLERGWTVALAHTRGGSELGKSWHLEATKLGKHKTVDDILACAHFLVAEGFTHESLLCGHSNSAGAGMLASAANLQPSLFKALHLSAPFLDIRGSLVDPNLPLAKSDYHEFGDPVLDPKAFDAISGICPYSNLQAQEYPAILITAFEADYRTPLASTLKFASKFRDTAKPPTRVKEFCDKNLALIIDQGSHLGTADDQANLERAALTTAFLEWTVDSMSTDVQRREKKKLFDYFFRS